MQTCLFHNYKTIIEIHLLKLITIDFGFICLTFYGFGIVVLSLQFLKWTTLKHCYDIQTKPATEKQFYRMGNEASNFSCTLPMLPATFKSHTNIKQFCTQ